MLKETLSSIIALLEKLGLAFPCPSQVTYELGPLQYHLGGCAAYCQSPLGYIPNNMAPLPPKKRYPFLHGQSNSWFSTLRDGDKPRFLTNQSLLTVKLTGIQFKGAKCLVFLEIQALSSEAWQCRVRRTDILAFSNPLLIVKECTVVLREEGSAFSEGYAGVLFIIFTNCCYNLILKMCYCSSRE